MKLKISLMKKISFWNTRWLELIKPKSNWPNLSNKKAGFWLKSNSLAEKVRCTISRTLFLWSCTRTCRRWKKGGTSCARSSIRMSTSSLRRIRNGVKILNAKGKSPKMTRTRSKESLMSLIASGITTSRRLSKKLIAVLERSSLCFSRTLGPHCSQSMTRTILNCWQV